MVLRLAETALARHDLAGARSRAAELVRLHIDRVRPDLSQDHERLRARLAEDGGPPA